MVKSVCYRCHGNHVLYFLLPNTNDNEEEQNPRSDNYRSQLIEYLITTSTTIYIPDTKKTKKTTTTTTIERESIMSAVTDKNISKTTLTQLYLLIREDTVAPCYALVSALLMSGVSLASDNNDDYNDATTTDMGDNNDDIDDGDDDGDDDDDEVEVKLSTHKEHCREQRVVRGILYDRTVHTYITYIAINPLNRVS